MKRKTNSPERNHHPPGRGARLQKILAAGIILVGLLILLYPWVSNYLFEHRVDSTVEVYEAELEEIDTAEREEMWEAAQAYNADLSQSQVMLTDPFLRQEESDEELLQDKLRYDELLQTDESGIMCFIDIPKIKVYLPVYHGTSNEVLEKGIGHIEGSSLPVGGSGTHAILSGHTGVNNAKLFTDLSEMEEGDLFFVHVLGRNLAYRVDRILVIEPEDTSRLVVEEDRDLVSLLTCTPYGVNTHRLVVTGERTDYTPEVMEEARSESSDSNSLWMKSYQKAIAIGIGIAAALLLLLKLIGSIYHRWKERQR